MNNYNRALTNTIVFSGIGIIVVAVLAVSLATALKDRNAKLTNKVEVISD